MPKSVQEALEESFEKAEEEAGGPDENTEESVGDTEEEEITSEDLSVGSSDGDDSSDGEESLAEGVDGDDSDDDEEKGDGPDKAEQQVSKTEAEPASEESPKEDLRAPVSWKPTTREHWAKLPTEVKQEVLKREQDIQKGLQQASQHKKIAEEYVHTLQPYQQMIQGSGATPSQAIDAMFSTASILTFGTPKQKAEKLAEVIENYSVDLEILDQTLAGMEVPDDANAGIMNVLREELAPVKQFMGQFQGATEQQTQQITAQVEQDLQNFAAQNEFYEDVREDMADIMEIAGKRGQTMTLEQAYERACQLVPEVKKVLDHRAARGSAARPNNDEISRKRTAASSVASEGPTGSGGKGSSGSLRDTIADAFDDLEAM